MSYIIPLTSDPAQRFEINLNNVRYFFIIKYNYNADIWALTIQDSSSTLIEGIIMLPGVNLLAPHEDITLGELWMVDQSEKNIDPDGENIGDLVKLIYYPPGESPDLPDIEELSV